MLQDKLKNVSSLMDMGESEIRTIMKLCGCREKEIARLLDAVKSLKKVYRGLYQDTLNLSSWPCGTVSFLSFFFFLGGGGLQSFPLQFQFHV